MKSRYINDGGLLKRLPVFYQPWWLDAVSTRWDVILISEQERIVMVWPYTLEPVWGLKLVRTPAFTPFLGPYSLSGPVQPEWMEAAFKLLPSVAFHQYIPHYHTHTGTAFPEQQYQLKTKRTYLIELDRELSSLYQSVDKKRQKRIEKATKLLHIREAIPDTDLLHEWLAHTFQQKGQRYPYPKQQIEKIISAAQEHDASICFTATDASGTIIAIQWLVYDQETMYNLLSVTHPQHKDGNAVSGLIWAAISKARSMKLKYFDFEGSSIPGIEEFFRSFGGIKTDYPVFSHTPSWIWKWKQKLL